MNAPHSSIGIRSEPLHLNGSVATRVAAVWLAVGAGAVPAQEYAGVSALHTSWIAVRGGESSIANAPAAPAARRAYRRIERALAETTSCDFDETPLAEAVEHFSTMHDIDIYLDTKALTDAAINAEAPITRRVRGMSLRSALRHVLRDLNLTFVMEDEVLLITTREVADIKMETRVYSVRDLIVPGDADSIINVITQTVDPTTWTENGGPGSILPDPKYPFGALVISQTQEVHERVAELLAMLRNDRAAASRRIRLAQRESIDTSANEGAVVSHSAGPMPGALLPPVYQPAE